jgi:hypothetical protein
LLIDTSFPKGKAMADWMKFLDPAVNYGEIAADVVFDNLTGATAPAARVWGSSASTAGPKPHPRIVTVNTPAAAPADQQCGRAVHLDAHIGPQAPLGLPPEFRRPLDKYCEGDMTKNQQALAFLFFDLASCIQDDSRPVDPPVIVP